MQATTTAPVLDLDTIVSALPDVFQDYELGEYFGDDGLYVMGREWEAHQVAGGAIRIERRTSARLNSPDTIKRKIRTMLRAITGHLASYNVVITGEVHESINANHVTITLA